MRSAAPIKLSRPPENRQTQSRSENFGCQVGGRLPPPRNLIRQVSPVRKRKVAATLSANAFHGSGSARSTSSDICRVHPSGPEERSKNRSVANTARANERKSQ